MIVSARSFALDPPSDDENKSQEASSVCIKAHSSQDGEKKSGSSALMQKIFGKHSSKDSKTFEITSRGEDIQKPFDVEFEQRIRTGKLAGVIGPCPFMRPLNHRLEPRDERFKRPSRSSTSSDYPQSPITIARNRGEANRLLTGAVSDEDLTATFEHERLLHTKIIEADRAKMELDAFDARYLSNVAAAFSSDQQSLANWTYFLQCYSLGNFNLSSPPPHPNLSPSFVYLPAVQPPHEEARMSLSAQYEMLWPRWAQDTACNLVKSVMKKFNVPYASISYFNAMYEVFIADNGYNQLKIDRATSIAAHILFSTHVLVVLDTEQDWRFKGNPLVTDSPRIRFFAGAPMLSSDGQVVGVLAIFDKAPHSEFSPLQQLELAEFSVAAIADVNKEADWLSDPEQRTTPLLQRESIINGDYQRQSTVSYVQEADVASIDYDLCPPALRFHKPRNTSRSLSRLLIRDNRDLFTPAAENTPPSSGEDGDELFYENPRSFINNRNQLSVSSGRSPFAQCHTLPRPDSRASRSSTPRPFSSSDVTSLHPHPPNTPILPSNEAKVIPNFEETIQRFMELSDGDCAEESEEKLLYEDTVVQSTPTKDLVAVRSIGSSPLIELSPPSAPPPRLMISNPVGSNRLADLSPPSTPPSNPSVYSSAYSSPLIDFSSPGPPPNSPPPPPTPRQNKISHSVSTPSTASPVGISRRSTASTIGSHPSQGGHRDMRDAAIECAKIAQNFGYDIIYVAESKTKSPYMTDAEVLAPGGMELKLLVAYGLKTSISLNKELHLMALRARGYDIWDNRASYQPNEYHWGLLIPVNQDMGPVFDHSESGPVRRRNSGVVIGAFHSTPEIGHAAKEIQKSDIHALLDACVPLKEIIVSYKRNRKTRKPPKRANTEPPTPCLPNEATNSKFNKFSLDAGDSRKNRTLSGVDDPLQSFASLKRRSAASSRNRGIGAPEETSGALSPTTTNKGLNRESSLSSQHHLNEGFEVEPSFSSQYQADEGPEQDLATSGRYPANAAFKRESATSSRYPSGEALDRKPTVTIRYTPSKESNHKPIASCRYPANEASEVQVPGPPIEAEDFNMDHISSRSWR